MTLANIALTPSSACLFADSRDYGADLARSNPRDDRVSKIRVLHHLQASFVMRGLNLHARDVELHARVGGYGELDAFLAAMPGVLRNAVAKVAATYPDVDNRAELHIAAWCPRAGRPRGIRFMPATNYEAQELPCPGAYFSPDGKNGRYAGWPGKVVTLADMIVVARHQHAAAVEDERRTGHSACLGGSLYVADISADSIVVSRLHQFGQPDEVSAR